MACSLNNTAVVIIRNTDFCTTARREDRIPLDYSLLLPEWENNQRLKYLRHLGGSAEKKTKSLLNFSVTAGYGNSTASKKETAGQSVHYCPIILHVVSTPGH